MEKSITKKVEKTASQFNAEEAQKELAAHEQKISEEYLKEYNLLCEKFNRSIVGQVVLKVTKLK